MAGRFAFHKIATSEMTRSISRRLVGGQASASFSRAATAASSSSRITAPVMPRASDDGIIRTLGRFFHGVAVHPGGNNVVTSSISNHGGSIRAYYGSPVAAKIRRLKANNHNKSSALVDSFVGEVKQTCSPDASNNLKLLMSALAAAGSQVKAFIAQAATATAVVEIPLG